MQAQIPKKAIRLSSFQVVVFGFLLAIALGTAVLMLPIATRDGVGADFQTALFTATSASCVTGLVLRDTVSYWSPFGQAVLLVLIQVGGMGVVTMAVTITILSGKRIGLSQRSTMQESIAAPQIGGIVRLTGFIVKTTAGAELIGAILLAPAFCRDYGTLRGLGYALFHSVSAFCNAGFDLLGRASPFSSLTGYAFSPAVLATVSALIVFGGIGFLTWDDIRCNRFRLSKYCMQSKVILITSGVLILVPAAFLYFCEFSSPVWADMTVGQRILSAFFQSVTARTAGFNSVDLSAMSEPGRACMTVLMLIGGSPGSTAGGMKTTTLAVLIFNMIAVFRSRDDAQCFGRRISSETVKYACVLFTLYVALFLISGLAISCIESLPLEACLFETASAVGTVGLSLGLTPQLGWVSRLILIVLMYFGRVGGLTLIFAVLPRERTNISKLPLGKITVG